MAIRNFDDLDAFKRSYILEEKVLSSRRTPGQARGDSVGLLIESTIEQEYSEIAKMVYVLHRNWK